MLSYRTVPYRTAPYRTVPGKVLAAHWLTSSRFFISTVARTESSMVKKSVTYMAHSQQRAQQVGAGVGVLSVRG